MWSSLSRGVAGGRREARWVRWALCMMLCLGGVWGCDDDAQTQQVTDTGAATGDAQTSASADTDAPPDATSAGDGEDATEPQPVITLTAGAFLWEIDADARRMTWRGAGVSSPLLVLDADALQIGEVAAVEDRVNYDPYAFKVSGLRKPPLKAWRPVQAMRVEAGSATASGVTLALDFEEGLGATLRIEVKGDGRLQLDWSVAQPERVGYLRVRPQVDGQEGFYGLGEVFDSVNHRGRVRAMQLEVDADLESGYNEAHVPIPFVIGTRGWGLLVESFYPAVFDVAAEAADRVDALFGVGTGAQAGLRLHVFAAAHPLDVTKGYYDVTGAPKLPAHWAFGPWIWRDENTDQAQVEDDLATIRDLDLPASGYWIDRPYATTVNAFDFSASMFTDPQAMIDGAHGLGFRMALWHTPYIDKAEAAVSDLRAQATSEGYYPPQAGVLLNPWGAPIDLTNPAAFAWWQGLIHRYTDMGIEGFKLDYAEDVVPGLLGARNVWGFADGSSERTMHARYQLFYHRVYAQTMPPDGGFLLCRGGTIGSQALGVIIWPGDLDANMAKHGEQATNREGQTYDAVGGLPASLVAALSLGPSGFAFYGSDTGGYRHSPPDKETFTRWFEQTALSTVMQIGTSTNDVAWEPTALNGFDAALLTSYRLYTRLHLRLFPYVWTYAERLREDGRPIMRPLGLAYPDLNTHPDDIYMLGDALLVAPVVTYGARSRAVTFPAGTWYDWWTGERITSSRPQTLTVAAPLDTLPLYIASGGIVPMLRPTIDTLASTDQPDRVDSYATSPGVLFAVLSAPEPEKSNIFQLFDGAILAHTLTSGIYTLTAESGAAFSLGLRAEVVGFDSAPVSATLDGAPFPPAASLNDLDTTPGWLWDGARLHLRLPPGTRTATWTL